MWCCAGSGEQRPGWPSTASAQSCWCSISLLWAALTAGSVAVRLTVRQILDLGEAEAVGDAARFSGTRAGLAPRGGDRRKKMCFWEEIYACQRVQRRELQGEPGLAHRAGHGAAGEVLAGLWAGGTIPG